MEVKYTLLKRDSTVVIVAMVICYVSTKKYHVYDIWLLCNMNEGIENFIVNV